MQEAVMARHETNSQKTGTVRGVTLVILGLTGLAGMKQIVSALSCCFGTPLNMALETLPSILSAVWHMLQPCAFGHLGLLERLLQVSISWHFVLTLAGV
jgi:hypothetical protein